MSSKDIKKIAVIGDGGWGTTLAIHLAKKKYSVQVWGPFPKYLEQVSKSRYNSKFLPSIRIPQNVSFTADLKEAVAKAELLVFAIPSQYARDILQKIRKTETDLHKKIFVSVTKGIDTKSLLRMSQIITEELGKIPLVALSGPTIAMEMAKGIPTTAVAASPDDKTAQIVQHIFNSKGFRIYTNTDVVGVELGGSVKNVIAIACGICDGLGLETNTKAAIVTRGLHEMTKLGQALGAKVHTFYGLSGLGDLTTTCFSPSSRNRTVGEELGKGKSIKQILRSMDMVAEGVETSKAVYHLSQKLKIPMPIATEVYRIIHQNKKASTALTDLMSREIKAE